MDIIYRNHKHSAVKSDLIVVVNGVATSVLMNRRLAPPERHLRNVDL